MTALLTVLALLGPIVVHDSRERSPLTSVGPRAGTVADVPWSTSGCPARGASGGCTSPANGQDRGIVRTGRHAGDWEMVQVRERRRRAARRGGLRPAFGRRAVPVVGGREARGAPGRPPRARIARGLLPPGGARPDVAGPQRRGRRPRLRGPCRSTRRPLGRPGCAGPAAGVAPARAGCRARWTHRAGPRSSPRGGGATPRRGPVPRGPFVSLYAQTVKRMLTRRIRPCTFALEDRTVSLHGGHGREPGIA